MAGFQALLAVLGCALIAYLLQAGWSAWRSTERRKELIRSMNALDELRQHSQEFLVPQVIQVTPNIHVAIGYALANTILIEGPSTIAIVDVTESLESGQEVMAAFRKITKKPVSDIVYTHYHSDHVNGAKAFIEAEAPTPTIWAHSLMRQEFENLYTGASEAFYARAMRQFGVFLPESVNSGIGLRLRFGEGMTSATKTPNRYVTEKETNVTLAGLDTRILHIPGETDDQIGIWIPDQKVFLCADDMYRAFPNLYAIRGTTTRSLRKWVSSLDSILNLKPDILIPSHTRPVIGREEIRDVMTLYRDAIQYVHDQTLRGINKGLHPDDVANELALPEHMASFPFLREFYGTVFWSSKAVFAHYFGWFSGDPMELYPMKRVEKSRRIIILAGGEDNALKAAKVALEEDDAKWGLELASHILNVNPGNTEAKKVRIECLTLLGSRELSANGRNYFLTSAFEEVSNLNMKAPLQSREAFIEEFDMAMVLSTLPVRFDAERCGEKNVTILFQFTDTNRNISMHMRNSIVAFLKDEPETPDISVKTTETIFRNILSRKKMAITAITLGELEIEGGIIAFKSFFDCFEFS